MTDNLISPSALLFDLDGTLLDSFTAHFRAYQAMLAHYGRSVTLDDLLAVYSPNWLEVYRAVGLPEDIWEEADLIWLEENARHPSQLFPGASDLLARLAARLPLGLVTSGSKERALSDLVRTGIAPFFQVIITGGDVPHPKPAPDGLFAACAALSVDPARALYVGDTATDYHTARAAGMPFAGLANRLLNGVPAGEYISLPTLTRLEDILDPS